MSTPGRGQGQQPPPPPAPVVQPSKPKVQYTPAGYGSSSEEDDMDSYYSPNVGKGGPVRTSSTLPKPAAVVSDDDDWSTGPATAAGPTSSAAAVAQPSTSTNLPTPRVQLNSRSALPQIPDINRSRCIVACRSINTVWSNGEVGKDTDIYISGIAKTLRTEFKDAKNPYATALNIMIYSIDFFRPKYNGSLSLEVMKEFKKWLLDSGGLSSFEKQYLNLQLQKLAFSVVTKQSSVPVLKIVCELFCLPGIRSEFIEPIKALCAEGNYKEACSAATYLGLLTEFEIHLFVIPLLLQTGENVAMDYLIVSKENQDAVTSFFDGILGESQPATALRNYVFAQKIDNVQFPKLEVKPLGKLLDRLRTKFGMDLVNCPNSGKRKRTAAIRHLMYRRYILRDDMSEEAFEGLVDDAVAKDETLMEETLSEFRNNYDYVGAAKFALRNAVPLHKIPYEIQLEMNKINPTVAVVPDKAVVQKWDEDWDVVETLPKKAENPPALETKLKTGRSLTPSLQSSSKPGISPFMMESAQVIVTTTSSVEAEMVDEEAVMDMTPPLPMDDVSYYKCPIPMAQIHYIDNPQLVQVFLFQLDAAVKAKADASIPLLIVGFDSEWKPMLAAAGVSLIQVALPDKIYLIDVYQLKRNNGNSECWHLLLEKFFNNEKIIKCGVGLTKSDVPMLAKTVEAWAEIKSNFKGGLDLSQLASQLITTTPQILPDFIPGNRSSAFGLSDLVHAFTGFRIKKDEQFSNWESRPLRESQINYAAADAYCLLELFNAIKSRAETVGINFDALVIKSLSGSSKPNHGRSKPTVVSAVELMEIGNRGKKPAPVDSPFKNPQPASEVKLIVDNNLVGVARLLRSCGIDTLMAKSDDAQIRCAELAVQQDRCIITTKSSYNIMAPYVPEGHCYLLSIVANDRVEELRHILTYFNVAVTNLDLYCRCQACNGNEFIKVRSQLLQELHRDTFPSGSSWKLKKDSAFGAMGIDEKTIESTSTVGMSPDLKIQTHRSWILIPETSLVTEGPSEALRTKAGATVAVQGIERGVLENVEYIYVCDNCGKCYWPEITAKESQQPSTSTREGNSVPLVLPDDVPM